MTSTLLLCTLLLAPATPNRGRPAPSKLELGQREFNRGDFQSALKALDAAAGETDEPAILVKVHLLRGQIFGAQQDFTRAEEAFALALERDPEAALDPARVDPALVKVLDGLRGRLSGEIAVRTDQPATVSIDGAAAGATPLVHRAPIGRRLIEATAPDGRYGARREVMVYPNRKVEAELRLEELPRTGIYEGTTPEDNPRRPFADLRGSLNPLLVLAGPGLEVGGGFEFPFYRASLHAQVYRDFGLTARGALVVPVAERLNGSVELELPVLFERQLALGLGGGGGLEYVPSKWMGFFLQLGARHFFLSGGERNRLAVQLGTRLRLP